MADGEIGLCGTVAVCRVGPEQRPDRGHARVPDLPMEDRHAQGLAQKQFSVMLVLVQV